MSYLRMTGVRLAAIGLLAALALAFVVGAGRAAEFSAQTSAGGRYLIGASAESKLKAILLDGGLKVKSVRCPARIIPRRWGTFGCKATGLDGSKGGIQLVQRDTKGHVTYTAPFLVSEDVSTSLLYALYEQAGSGDPGIEVSCQDIIVDRDGVPFSCTVTYNGKKSRVSIKQDEGLFVPGPLVPIP